MCAHRLIPAFCLVAFGAGSLLAQREIKETPVTGTGQGIVWRAALTRFQKSGGGYRSEWSTPAWRVNLKISNYTSARVQLGGLLAVIEAAEGSDEYASVYIALHPQEDDPSLKMVEQRYGFKWGVDVVKEGAPWPLVRVAREMNATDLFFLMGNSPREDNFPGGGFGSVSPRSQREIVEEVLFPIGLKTKVSQVVVVAPSYQGTTGSTARQEIFIFDAASFDLSKPPRSDQEFKDPKVASVTRTAASSAATAASESDPAWRRILALNWLAETDLPTAEPVLLRFGTGTGNEQIQLAAIGNLGAWKVKAAVGPLTTLLGTAGDAVKAKSVQALGEIGDSAAAPALRPLLNDQKLKLFAVETLGKLRDAESVPFLLADVRKGTREDSIPASVSLGLIASESAVDGLAIIASDKKAGRFARIRAWVALSAIGNAKTLGLAATTLGDKQEKDFHSWAVDTLAALIKSGNVDARAALTKYAEQPDSPQRSQARKALGLPE
jgi:HEAT repeat protein